MYELPPVVACLDIAMDRLSKLLNSLHFGGGGPSLLESTPMNRVCWPIHRLADTSDH